MLIKKIKFISTIFFIYFLQIVNAYNDEYREIYKNILDEKTYVLDSFHKNENITLTFNKNNISGKAIINKYNAIISINNENIEIKNISTTKMNGPKNLMKIEDEYLTLLSNAKTINIKGNILVIKTKDEKELIFKEKVNLSTNYLNGKKFTLKNSFDNLNVTIYFTKNHIYGYNNSSRYLSSYKISDNKISIKDIKIIESSQESTRYEEDRYINMFTDVYKIDLENKNLILTTRNKKEKLIYEMMF